MIGEDIEFEVIVLKYDIKQNNIDNKPDINENVDAIPWYLSLNKLFT